MKCSSKESLQIFSQPTKRCPTSSVPREDQNHDEIALTLAGVARVRRERMTIVDEDGESGDSYSAGGNVQWYVATLENSLLKS